MICSRLAAKIAEAGHCELESSSVRSAIFIAIESKQNKPSSVGAASVRLKVRTNNEVKVLIGSSTGLSVAEGNCVVERRGGEQPEANDQSINKTMLNSIRPDALASPQMKGEAKNGIRPGKGERKIRDLA